MKSGEAPPVGGSAPPGGMPESRLPATAGVGSGNRYRAASPTTGFTAAPRGPLLSQQQLLLRRQQVRGAQQQQPLPPLEGDKNVITLYHSVITATIQRCAQLQNAKVLDAIERHWRMALQRRTAELRRSTSSSVSVSTSSSTRGGNTQQHSRLSTTNNGSSNRSGSSGSRTSSAAAAEPRTSEQHQKREKSGTAVEAVVTSGANQTLPQAAGTAEQKQGQDTGVNTKSETVAAVVPKISRAQEETLVVNVKQEHSRAETTEDAARGGGGRAAGAEGSATIHGVHQVKEEEDDDDDEFADADVDEAKPASEAADLAPAVREEAGTTEATVSVEKAKETRGDAAGEATARGEEGSQARELAGAAAAKSAKEHAQAESSTLDFFPQKAVEPLDFEQPESLDEVSDIDDQEPPTTDGIFALYEKVQRCGSSGRKATNWKVTLRHGIIRAAHQEIAFDRLHAELRF